MDNKKINPEKLYSLKRMNVSAAILHFFQGSIIMGFAYTLQRLINYEGPAVFSNFLTFIPGEGLVNETVQLFIVPFIQLVAIFLLLTAVFHIALGTVLNKKYNKELQKNINPFRWIEYSITSSIMIVLIALLYGVNDVGALILLVSLNIVMNLTGLVMERSNRGREKVEWSSFIVGTIAGLAVWAVILLFGYGNSNWGEVPLFVYAVTASYFIFFNLFPLNMFLQYKKVGKWKDYAFGETMYIVLSFLSKSILAWIVFAGILQP